MKSAIKRLLIVGLLIGPMAMAGLAKTSAHQEAAHPAHIHNGTCDTLGDVIAVLSEVSPQLLVDGVASAGASSVGTANPVETDVSVTNVPMTLADIVAGTHSINVHRSETDISAYIACGEIGGPMIGASDLVVALRERNRSGESGVAHLHDNGDGTTTVTLMLVQTQPAAPVAATGNQVQVTLGDMFIQSNATSFKAGQAYTFTVTNVGNAIHEMVIEHSGDVDQPLEMPGGGEAEAADIPPGASGTLTFAFPEPGKYQLACHVPGHYEAGMVIQIEVTE